MKILRSSSEAEMLLCFLKAEYTSPRFAEDLHAAMAQCHAEPELILQGDPENEMENALRAEVMGQFRGYGRDEELFQNFPVGKADWVYAQLEAEDLARIRYIDYSYWNEISNGTSCPLDAVGNIRADHRIFDVPHDRFLAGEQFLRSGGKFPPIVLLWSEKGPYVIVEGHLRMTAYALAPEFFPGTFCYLGTCTQDELKRWNVNYD